MMLVYFFCAFGSVAWVVEVEGTFVLRSEAHVIDLKYEVKDRLLTRMYM